MDNNLITIFRDEKSIIFLTYNKSLRSGLYFMTDWSIAVPRDSDFKRIGEAVLDIYKYIGSLEPVEKQEKIEEPWKKHSKYKSWKKFLLNTAEISVYLMDDDKYSVSIIHRLELKRSADKVEKSLNKNIKLPLDVGAEEMGRAVVEILDAADAIYNSGMEIDAYPETELEMDNGAVLIYRTPEDDKFNDEGDCHAAEVYQAYSYVANDYSEPKAWFSLSPAAYFDAMPTEKELIELWEEQYESAEGLELAEENMGMFTLRAEMHNKKYYKLSYFADLGDEFLLECSMEVEEPNRRKKMLEKLKSLFVRFVKSCKIKER